MLRGVRRGILQHNINRILPDVVFEREQQQMGVDEAEPPRLVEPVLLALARALDVVYRR